jgi:hypothetical protein
MTTTGFGYGPINLIYERGEEQWQSLVREQKKKLRNRRKIKRSKRTVLKAVLKKD